jgi:NTE family protein
MDTGDRRTDLVLEGGGVKGMGLVGAITALAGHGYTFPRIAGTSAGGIVGALVTAYQQAGRGVDEIVPVMDGLDYRRFADATLLDRLGIPGKALAVLLHDGIYPGDYALRFVADQLAACGVRTWGDLRATDPDSSLPPGQRYRLVVTATDLTRGQLVRLPWDYHEYGLDADTQPVALAVRASMSVPFYFRPVTLRCGPPGGHATLVDGGLLSNFPVELFDRTDGRPARWPTVGIKLSARPGSWPVAEPVGGPAGLALAAVHTLMGAHDAYHLDDEHTTARTIFVDTSGVDSLDFDIDAATRQRLYRAGRAAAAGFLDSGRLPAAQPSASWPAPGVPGPRSPER